MSLRYLQILLLSASLVGAGCKSHDAIKHDDHGEHNGHSAEERHEEEGVVELSEAAAARVKIRVVPVVERALAGMLSTTGRVGFDEDHLAHVSPRVPGRVTKVEASLGAKVKAGQTLAVIDSIELGRAKSDYLRAKAQLSLAQRTLEREQGLLKDRITSEQSALEAQASHQRALAEFQAARQQLRLLGLSDRQIKRAGYENRTATLFPLSSPISGTVVEKHLSLGEVVSPQRTVFTVADLSRLWVWIDIYERDLAAVHLEDDVAVKVDAYPNRTFKGKVAYIRDQVDPDTRTARARIDVPNADGSLRAGMFATVTVTDPHGEGGAEIPKMLVVPAGAIQRDGTQSIAFVAAGNNRYEKRVVVIGRRTSEFAEVLSGLKKGESVAVEGTFILKSEAAKEHMGGGHDH